MRLSQVDAFVVWVATVTLLVTSVLKAEEENIPDGMSRLSLAMPDLDSEESQGNVLPENLKCDACQAIAHQFYFKYKAFNDLNKHSKLKVPKPKALTKKICTDDTFDEYGIKTVKGINHLHGPGIDTDGELAMIISGGMWSVRLAEMCVSLVEVLGEETIYETFLKSPSEEGNLRELLCNGAGAAGSCNALNNFKTEL